MGLRRSALANAGYSSAGHYRNIVQLDLKLQKGSSIVIEADSRPGAVIWDVDGTLIDTAELHYRAWKELAQRLGKQFTREEFATTFGRRNPEIIRQVFGEDQSDKEVSRLGEEKEEIYRAAARRGIQLLPGTRSLLESLGQAGFAQAIGSSAPRANLDIILRMTGIEKFFNVIISMEDTDRGKPDPQVFLRAAERLKIDPARCVVIEDALAGVEAAHRAGMKSVAVRFVGHHSEESLRKAGADIVLDSLEDLSAQQIARLVGRTVGACNE
jgi:beta-phosphoglucomutase